MFNKALGYRGVVAVGTVLMSVGACSALAGPVSLAETTAHMSPGAATALTVVPPANRLSPTPPSDRRVLIYGDSLAAESQAYFVAALASAGISKVTARTFGGTAICDWLSQMRQDATGMHPNAVIVEFSGNALTPCMRATDGTALSTTAYFDKYAADTAEVLDIFTPGHTSVFFAGAPISRRAELAHDPTTAFLHAIYAERAGSTPYGHYTDAGASVLLDGHWTQTLPCLPIEPCTGRPDDNGTPVNVVRAPDGGHFCPGAPVAVRGVTAACPVWSSGAWRFGNAMAAPVIEQFAPFAAANHAQDRKWGDQGR